MRPKEPIDPMLPGGDSPVPIPPVEDAWLAMRRKLDEEMPEERKRRRWLLLLLLLLPLLIWWWSDRGHGTGSHSGSGGAQLYTASPRPVDHHTTQNDPQDHHSAHRGIKRQPEQHMDGASTEAVKTQDKKAAPANPKTSVPPTWSSDRRRCVVAGGSTDAISNHRNHARQLYLRDRVGVHSVGTDKQHGMQQGGHLPASGSTDQPAPGVTDQPASAATDLAKLGNPTRSDAGHSKDLSAVAVDAQLAALITGRITGIDGPPLDPKHKAAASVIPPKKKPQPGASPKKDDDRIFFAAGLADSKSFPMGAQQVVDLNANLKKDVWFDYVPTPYFQYHPSRKLYLQFGIQFNSPQYTEAVTIFSKPDTSYFGRLFNTDTATIVKKLYYFNFPLTVYYSPVRNVHLGVGIQYSNLRNGIAFQNRVMHFSGTPGGGPDSTQLLKPVTLKDDAPAYQNLRKSDWRALFEVNYYWRRITVGLQYQEALGQYLYNPVEGSQGKDRNSSLNLYLRYNIWEKRIKDPPASKH